MIFKQSLLYFFFNQRETCLRITKNIFQRNRKIDFSPSLLLGFSWKLHLTTSSLKWLWGAIFEGIRAIGLEKSCFFNFLQLIFWKFCNSQTFWDFFIQSFWNNFFWQKNIFLSVGRNQSLRQIFLSSHFETISFGHFYYYQSVENSLALTTKNLVSETVMSPIWELIQLEVKT